MRQVASMSFNIRAEELLDGTMIYVSISTDTGSEWMGTEEQFRKMFSVSGKDRRAEVNNLAAVLQSLWDDALARNLRSNNPGLRRHSLFSKFETKPLI